MTSKSIVIFLMFFCSIPLLFCKKKSGDCQYASVPNSLFFQIRQNGIPIGSDTLNNVRISYYNNGTKIYIKDLIQATDLYSNRGILTTRTIGTLGANTYFIEYPNLLKTDTLFVEYLLPSPSTNCVYVLQDVRYNSIAITANNTFGAQPVYVLNKSM